MLCLFFLSPQNEPYCLNRTSMRRLTSSLHDALKEKLRLYEAHTLTPERPLHPNSPLPPFYSLQRRRPFRLLIARLSAGILRGLIAFQKHLQCV